MKKNGLLCLLLLIFCLISVKFETAVGFETKEEPDVYKLSQVNGEDLELLHLMGAILYENVDEDTIVVKLYPDGTADIAVEVMEDDAFWKSGGKFLKIFKDTDKYDVLWKKNGNDIVFTADGIEIRGTLSDDQLTLFFDDITYGLDKITPKVFVPGGDVYKLYSMMGLSLSTLISIGFDTYGLDSVIVTIYPDGTALMSVSEMQVEETVSWKLDGTKITFYSNGEERYGMLSGDALILDNDVDTVNMVKVIDKDGTLIHYPDDTYDVTITNGISVIGEKVFYEKKKLTTVVIPESVTFIGDEAFAKCGNLNSVTIPASVTYIADNAFSECGKAVLKVELGSYAADYAKYHNIDYVYIWQDYEFRLRNDGTAEITAYNGSRQKVDFPYSIAGIRVSSIGGKVFRWDNETTTVTIPEGITSIGGYAFANCPNLAEVTLPDGLTSIGEAAFSENSLIKVIVPDSVSSIGDKAFFGCKNLTSVTLPGSLTEIGNETFSGCINLTSITLPDSLTTIGGGAFSKCGNLAALTIPDSVTFIGNSSFYNCNRLTLTVGETSYARKYADEQGINYLRQPWWDFEYNILADGTAEITRYTGSYSEPLILSDINGAKITSIGDHAFENNKSMKTLSIPGNITVIGDWAFKDCISLTSLSIPDSIVSIGEAAFYGCESLTSITIPDGIKLINWNLFWGCSKLQSVTLPESIESIDSYAFRNCGSLASVNIPDRVTTIGTEAFYGCSGLKSLAIPDSVTSIGSNAFKYCDQLVLTVGENSYAREYAIENWLKYTYAGVADNTAEPVTETSPAGTEEFEISSGGVLVKYHGNASSVVIPDGVISIGDQAFAEHRNLSAITIPDSVTSIGSRAFLSCGTLTDVTIPNSVTSIGEGAFTGCKSLTSVTIPESITTIPQNAFGGCDALTSISIPAGIISIGEKAFAGCPRLESVIIPANIASIAEDAFNQNVKRFFIDENGILVKFAFNGIASPVKIPEGVTAVGENVFSGLPMVSSVVIPDGVTYIGKNAFDWCVNLTSVTIPDSVTFIGEKAFANCENLMSVTIPAGISSIPASTFSGCTALTSITIPDGVSSIGDWAFTSCSSLASLSLPESLESIGDGAFSLCGKLTSVFIPGNVKSIGNAAFTGCFLLKSVTLPENAVFSADGTFDMTTELMFYEPADQKSAPSGTGSPESEYTAGTITPLYQEFLEFLKAYITAEDRNTVAINNDTYGECLDVINLSWWNIEDAGFAFMDIDGNGTAELLLGNYKYGGLWFVYAADHDQLSAVLHSGYKNTFILNTDGTFLEDLMMGAASSEVRYYIYEKGEIRSLQSADYNSRSHTPAKIEFVPLVSYETSYTAPVNEEPEPVKKTKSYPKAADIITFGSYEQDNKRGNGQEPIEWKVLSIENGQMLILSTKVLDAMAFNSGGTNSWDVSSLRKWMQNTFINQAFSMAEKGTIRKVSHKAGPLDTYPDEDTVFILSMDEIRQYLPNPSDRQIAATPYAKNRGVFLGANGLACWWTRTYFSKGTAYNIWSTGELDHGDNVTTNDGGILPAVWIDIEKWMNLP